MLIINADDWGRSGPETDAALACYQRGVVTSVSAMVFMADSGRAAHLSKEIGIDSGLHLNLTERFSSSDVPSTIAEAQQRIIRFLTLNKYALILFNPLLCSDFRVVYEAQALEFARLYGRPPSRVDGHQHMHLCSNILLGGFLPAGIKVRRSFSFWRGEKSRVNRTYRRIIDWHLLRKYRLTDYFFSLGQCIRTQSIPRVAQLAKNTNVELMTHPIMGNEFGYLLNDSWLETTYGLKMGTYGQL